MSMKLTISIGLIILNHPELLAHDTNWISTFAKSVQNDRNIYQVIFFIDEKTVQYNLIFENLITTVSKNIPILEMNTPINEKPTKLDIIRYKPRVSLFILTNSDKDPELTRKIDFLTKLSEERRRPKCFLLLFHKIENYQKFFEKLWSSQFLDFTLIEIETIRIRNDKKKTDTKFTIVYYNPFSKTITNENVSSKTVWFPEKMKNFHGYPIVASLLHAPPDVIITESPKRQMSGLGINKINVLQEIMNFTLVESTIADWGILTCKKEGSAGLGLAIYTNEIQIMGMEVSIAFCDVNPIELSKSLRSRQIGLVVPLIKTHADSTKFQWQIKSILLVMILPLFLCGISRLFEFPRKKWKVHYMLQITLGNVVPQEPETTIERIIYAAFLIGCFMFSSEIYTAINQVQLETKSSFKFETLDDVLASDVQILIDKNYYFMMNNTDDVVLQKILNKTDWMTFQQDECVERVLKYKNLTCILEVPRAELQLRDRKDKCGGPLVKFLNNKFPFDSGSTQLATGVPYTRRFDQIIQRIIDSGIKEKWMEVYFPKKTSSHQVDKSCSSNEPEPVMAIHQIILILITGFASSSVTFIIELLIYHILRKEI